MSTRTTTRTLVLLEAPLSERGRALADGTWAVEPRPSIAAALSRIDQVPVDAVVVTPAAVTTPSQLAPFIARGVPVLWWGDPARLDVAEAALAAGASHFVPRAPGSERLVRVLLDRMVETDFQGLGEPDTDAGVGSGTVSDPVPRPSSLPSDRGSTVVEDRPDVLERAATDTRLQDRSVLEGLANSSVAVYILGDDGFRYVNPAFSRLFGISQAELVRPGLDFMTLVAPDSRRLVKQRRALAAQHSGPTRYEFRALHRTGREFDVEVSVSQIELEGETCVLGVLQDITLRKQYEADLVQKNRELSIVLTMSEAVAEGRDARSMASWVCQRLVGALEVDCAAVLTRDEDHRPLAEVYPPEFSTDGGLFDVDGRPFDLQIPAEDMVLSTLQPEDWGASEGFVRRLVLPLRVNGRDVGTLLLLSRHKSGLPVRDLGVAVGVARQLALGFEQVRLNGKAAVAVQRLKALSEIGHAIGSSLDVEGVFRIVGQRLLDLVPYERAVLAIGRNDDALSVRVFDRPIDGTPAQVELARPIQTVQGDPLRAVVQGRTLACLLPGSGFHPDVFRSDCHFTLVPVLADGDSVGVLALGTERSARLRRQDLKLLQDLAAHMGVALRNARIFHELDAAYRRLRDMREKLGLSEKLRALGELAAGVAHDFNNVLSTILGRAQMLKVQLQSRPDLLKSVQVIEQAAADGARTVRRIAEFAKDKAQADMVPIRLNTLVRDAVEMCATRSSANGTDVRLDLQEVEPTLGQPTELREVLVNLIHNGIDAMGSGGLLQVATGSDPERGVVWVTIRDHGVGMDASTQERIFDPFFTTKGPRGTGLGLAVSFDIVHRHQGEISVQSATGRGSTFTVRLPVRDRSDSSALPLEFSEATPLPQLGPVDGLSALRVLVVDDDRAIRDVLAELLRSEGLTVHTVGSGSEALECLACDSFDVVLTDLGMPDVDGWAVVSGVRRTQTTASVAIMTGQGEAIDRVEARSRGADYVLSKPFRFEQIRELLSMIDDPTEAEVTS